MMKRIVLVLLFSLTASAYAGGWEKPDAATLNELFSDTTVYGSQFVVYYAPDGTQKGKWGGKQYNGDWKINEEGHVCSRWGDWKSDAEEWGCWSVEVKEGKQKLKQSPESGRADKSYRGLKYKTGNAENL